MALRFVVSAALLHATGLGKRRWASPFLAVKTACNFNLCKNFRLECFQSVLYETEASGTLWLLLGVNGTWWCFLLFRAFFFLRERERERAVDNFLCSVVDWRIVENFSVDDACPSESTAYHQSFLLFCLLCFWVQKVGGKKEGHSIVLDQHHHHHFSSPSNRLLMFLQSPDSQMHGGLYPSLDESSSSGFFTWVCGWRS